MKRQFGYRFLIGQLVVVGFLQPLSSQNSAFLESYWWGEDGYQYYVLNKDVVHQHISTGIDLFKVPYNGAIVHVNDNALLTFIADPFWNRIVYANYHDTWTKAYGDYGSAELGQFKHPHGVAATTVNIDGTEWDLIYVADTHNGRIVLLAYDRQSEEIGPTYIGSDPFIIGQNLVSQPWDLDIDDRGTFGESDDICWVVDKSAEKVVPIEIYSADHGVWGNGPITHLYNSSTHTYYWDLSGLCGVAIRTSGQGFSSTSNRRLYLVDWKLRKLFLVEAETVENGQGLIYRQVNFGNDVLLSGVESDYFGDVWVVDNSGGKIYKYTWDLQYLDELSGLNRPTSVASVRRHHLNMAISEHWTNTTGNRTYSHGADIRNLSISTSTNVANFDFLLTNYSKLTAKVYKGSTLKATLEDGTQLKPSGDMSLSWYQSSPSSGPYTLKLWARSYDDPTNVYRYSAQNFNFKLKATISGPSVLGYKQTGTWTANVTGGSGSTSYRWYKKYDGSSYWYTLGTSQSQSVTMLTTGFTMKVVVTRGSETVEATKYCEYFGAFKVAMILPQSFDLSQNFPNPFNPMTTIKYDLPEDSFVELTIYDLLGHEVRTLTEDNEAAGFKSVLWDGKNSDGSPVSSGMYFYRLDAISYESDKEFHQTRKLILLR